MKARRRAHGGGLAAVAAAHALLLAWAWTQTPAFDPPGPPTVAVLMARPVPAAPDPAQQGTPPAPRLAPSAAGRPSVEPLPTTPHRLPAAAAAAATAATAAAADPLPPEAVAVPAPGTDGPGGPGRSGDERPAVPAIAATTTPPALPAAGRAAAAPAAQPRRVPADHAGCAEVPHPRALRERGIEGQVQLRVQVGSDGLARQVQLAGSSGWRLFDEAALAKARSCRFRPAYEGETAVESWVEFPVRFTLTQS
jgi:protein TonB